MSQNLKTPAKADTKDRGVTTTRQPKHTPKQNVCKCPRCQWQGPAAMFKPGWPEELAMLAARFEHEGHWPDLASYSIEDSFRRYLRLLRQGG